MQDQQSKDLAYIKHWEDHIAFWQKAYLEYMGAKNFSMADNASEIIRMYQEELSNAKSDYQRDYGQVSSTPTAGDKTVFIVER